MLKFISGLKTVIFFLGLSFSAALLANAEEDLVWNGGLKQKLFGDKTIQETNDIIELTAPYRAEDPALVPISVTSKIPQTTEKYIKTITLVIDNNPTPFAAAFNFAPDSGKADIGMRVRVNAYTPVRAIAETNDGKLTMSRVFVKASGGCSAPISADMEAQMARMGKMKFRLEGDKLAVKQPNQVQLLISHPNITGMQMDQITRIIKPAHFVEQVKVSFDGKPVMTAQTDIAISADPNFRFYFKPDKAGELKAEIRDNMGNQFTDVQMVAP